MTWFARVGRAAGAWMLASALVVGVAGCSRVEEEGATSEPAAVPVAEMPQPDVSEVRGMAKAVFGVLPADVAKRDEPLTEARTDLGRMLYFDARLSKNHDVSCNSCHGLDTFGVDGEATSPGHKGQRGDRNSPTVYNAALHLAQFWDGRAEDVEAQAKGPVLNPIEMAMPSEEAVLVVLRSIPGYAPAFAAAFPEDEDPITYDNMARAIGAFERRLLTPGPLDAFLEGDDDALSDEQVEGLSTFMATGCITCHNGPAVGGAIYQKLGLVKPYPTEDPGREAVTGREQDRHFFKVPSLRNVTKTGPWFHDGSIASLDDAIVIMADHQLGKTLSPGERSSIAAFLGALTGTVDAAYVAKPELPESGPETPAPDPT